MLCIVKFQLQCTIFSMYLPVGSYVNPVQGVCFQKSNGTPVTLYKNIVENQWNIVQEVHVLEKIYSLCKFISYMYRVNLNKTEPIHNNYTKSWKKSCNLRDNLGMLKARKHSFGSPADSSYLCQCSYHPRNTGKWCPALKTLNQTQHVSLCCCKKKK